MNKSEQQKLDKIASWYTNQNWGFYTKLVHMGFRTIEPHLKPGSMLEVGPADGEMTKFLLPQAEELEIVDAAQSYVDKVKLLDSRIVGYCSLIEDFDAPKLYDNVVFAHVLEHVVNPVEVLKRLSGFLKPGGRLHIIVPNANSLHRQVGVKMGMMKDVHELNDADKSVDHKRVYDHESLSEDVKKAGMSIVEMGGIFYKPLSNSQIEAQWSDELIEGFFQLGKDYPYQSSELFVIAENRG